MSRYGRHLFLDYYLHKNNCKKIMEIGVFNGDNARRMVEGAIKKCSADEVAYYGFDYFFSSMLNQVRQKLEKTGCKFELFKGDTINTIPKTIKALPKMDLIFIDGGKSYEEAKSDWENSKTLMHDGTAVFVHNYEFTGVKRMVDNIDREGYQVEIIYSLNEGNTALIKKKILVRS